MDLRYGREVTVGTLVLVAIVIFVLGTMWLSGRSISSDDLLKIRFKDVSGLKRASPVRVSGVTVGKVESIDFIEAGNVLVSVTLADGIIPKTDAQGSIVSVSLVGDYAIDVLPGDAPTPLPEGAVIIGTRPTGLSEQAAALSGRADTILAGLQRMVSPEMTERLEQTMEALQGTLAATQQTMQLYADPVRGPSAELTRTMAQFRELSAQLETTLANPGLQNALSRSDSLVTSLTEMSRALAATGNQVDTLLAGINAGQGTLGKFATDSAFYYGIVRVTNQLDSLMAEIKRNPGKIPVTVRIF